MASQLDMLLSQEREFLVAGDTPSFGSVYSDMGIATQATTDWNSLIVGGIGKVVDLELMKRYSPDSGAQVPRIDGGAAAGVPAVTPATAMASAAPWLIGGAVLLVVIFAMRR
jgi:hypothetical protein